MKSKFTNNNNNNMTGPSILSYWIKFGKFDSPVIRPKIIVKNDNTDSNTDNNTNINNEEK